jgi:hypothetical protein
MIKLLSFLFLESALDDENHFSNIITFGSEKIKLV